MDGWTALHHAANGGYAQVVELLLNQSANAHAETIYKRAALHFATMRGNFKIV